jgi:hypothetical protein
MNYKYCLVGALLLVLAIVARAEITPTPVPVPLGGLDKNQVVNASQQGLTATTEWIAGITSYSWSEANDALNSFTTWASTALRIPFNQASMLVGGILILIIAFKIDWFAKILSGILRWIIAAIAVIMILVGMGVI